MKKKLLIALVLLMLFPVGVNAIPVAETSWTGSRSTAGGTVVAAGGWDGTSLLPNGQGVNNGFEIGWNISLDGSVYTYIYTISGVGGLDLGKGLSHWILEVTDPSLRSDFFNFSTPIADGPRTFTPNQGNSNPNMPGDIYGVKWEAVEDEGTEATTIWVLFQTFKDPVWGDFYGKDGILGLDGVWTTAWNLGFGEEPDPERLTRWIPTPNSAVPEPATILLLGIGLGAVGLLGRKRLRGSQS